MKNPVCGNCSKEMVLKKNGVTVLYTAWNPPQPYQAWHADAHKCLECGAVVVSGFADGAFWNHFDNRDVPIPDAEFVFVVGE